MAIILLNTLEELASKDTSNAGWIPIVMFFILLCVICFYFVRDTQKISVEPDKITYTNWLTGKLKTYYFKDLDGYLIITRRSDFKKYESVALKKGINRMGEISSFFYSNYEELVDGLKKDLKFLGQENVGRFGIFNRERH